MSNTWDPTSLEPAQAIYQLALGNQRFRAGKTLGAARTWNPELAKQRHRPFAIVLGCSDARTPVEIVFDQGYGDLFVVRVAGNIVAPSIVGSIEFAASQFGARLVVVMGHTHCGAVGATVEALRTGEGSASQNIRAITDRISPHVEPIVHAGGDDVLRHAMHANVKASVNHLRYASRILEDLVLAGRLAVVGAEYELESGVVRFIDTPTNLAMEPLP